MTVIRATNITWHEGHVKREDREKLLAQNGATIWFTGLSVAGKGIGFTGVDDPYEPPLSPEIVIHNDRITPQEAAAQVMRDMESRGLLPELK
jgi:adenylylsulfate kinase-like enzyme